ncbi:fumarate reductase subunit FrdD [uncultured Rhodospira sp.]|uniref:fumarate reductase subunit FrdD n=1 Tax=uncultured Rhodospira sp. TaxID=1936189 RepID=UPI002602A355|nr:fumarate reductase subunit FrdD [uncultured Rhodospira sp.]
MAKSNKPIVWGLFAAGGTVAAFVIPVMILITGFLLPLGLFGSGEASYERMSEIVGNPLVKIVLFGIIVLALWHAAHRLRITAHDFGIRNDALVARGVYGFAALFSLIALMALLSI